MRRLPQWLFFMIHFFFTSYTILHCSHTTLVNGNAVIFQSFLITTVSGSSNSSVSLASHQHMHGLRFSQLLSWDMRKIERGKKWHTSPLTPLQADILALESLGACHMNNTRCRCFLFPKHFPSRETWVLFDNDWYIRWYMSSVLTWIIMFTARFEGCFSFPNNTFEWKDYQPAIPCNDWQINTVACIYISENVLCLAWLHSSDKKHCFFSFSGALPNHFWYF